MKKVIIVDNDPSFRKGLRTILENIGNVAYIEEAANGEEFLKMLLRREFDLVFIDLKMPVMDGIEATKKAHSIYHDLIIVAFSAYESEYYRKLMMDAGANDYLFKMDNNYDALTEIMNDKRHYSGKIIFTHI